MDNKKKKDRFTNLHDYRLNYNVDLFMADLVGYFEGKADLNTDKIKSMIEVPGELDRLIRLAETKQTHPVLEFIQKLFKDLTKEGK